MPNKKDDLSECHQYVDAEISIGDYVVSGGELPAMVLLDAVGRLVPRVVGAQQSVEEDSLFNGLLQGPQYTRPAEFAGTRVPAILLSGNHATPIVERPPCGAAAYQEMPNSGHSKKGP